MTPAIRIQKASQNHKQYELKSTAMSKRINSREDIFVLIIYIYLKNKIRQINYTQQCRLSYKEIAYFSSKISNTHLLSLHTKKEVR